MYTVIGDIVGSRSLKDRARAQQAILATLARVSSAMPLAQRLEPTFGDEIQGGFKTVADATLATLLIRLELHQLAHPSTEDTASAEPAPDLVVMRFGIGNGDVRVFELESQPIRQDGPGWHAARDAIDSLGRKPGTRYAGPTDSGWPAPAPVNAFLVARDGLVDTLNHRQRRMLLSALHGKPQKAIAEREGISESAVSQAFSKGVSAVRDAQALFGKA
ncbi:sigma factor-like helix-turn-helix DNA-binding protein [Promicromonospora sp. Populi]|uniref:sigma factor-like helix-turn-helix DNA-binding protein n=1 Tax=Promicromonospora sp. Populi TaxID=3239420 RepID=UPI0034E2786A